MHIFSEFCHRWAAGPLKLLLLLLLSGLLGTTVVHAQQTDQQREDTRKSRMHKAVIETYGSTNDLLTKASNEYDRKGNLIETVGFSTIDGRVIARWTYAYDSRNKLIEWNWNGARYTAAYVYNDRGQLIGTRTLNSDGTLHETRRATLDANGKVLEEVSYNPQGGITGTYRSTYDPAGNLAGYVELDSSGHQVHRLAHSFNAQGNAVQSLSYGPDDRLATKTIYRYDGDHLSEQLDYAGDGSLSARVVNKRDSAGFVVEAVHYNASGAVESRERFTYEFYS